MQLSFDPKDDPDRPWVTVGPHTFDDGFVSLRVEGGFRSDLASVPWFVRPLFNPNDRSQRAALFHDAAYSRRLCSRFTADAAFRTIMRHDGVPFWKRLVMYMAVRLFGGLAWRAKN